MFSYSALSLSVLSLVAFSKAQETFSACPLLGPRFPISQKTASSPIIQAGAKNLTDTLDAYLAAADGEFGPITPNTTSFSIALFSTEKLNISSPFFYEYHYTAASLRNSTTGVKQVDADTVYRIGDLTTLLTTYLFLKEAGEAYWSEPVTKYVPELVEYGTQEGSGKIQWEKITLGDLASHLSGIGRYTVQPSLDSELANFLNQIGSTNTTKSACASGSVACDRGAFLSYFGQTARSVFTPASTPIFSNAGFIILAYALESISGRPFTDLLTDSLISPLNLSSTSLHSAPTNRSIIPSDPTSSQWNNKNPVEAPFNGIYSSLSDITAVMRSIVASEFLDQDTTNRWLKPVTHTSNRANSVGRPWEIYSLTVDGPSPVIPIYQVRGNVGFYSAHVGLAPDYNTGFVILGADSEQNPDLNAHADLISVALVSALEENAITQASLAFAGAFEAETAENKSTVHLTIDPATDSTPGLAVSSFSSSSFDILSFYARQLNIEASNLSARLYPTNTGVKTINEEEVAFRAVFQDKSALADAGTPTCETWRYVDGLQLNGIGLDEFIFKVGANGKAMSVEVPALNLQLAASEEEA